MKSQELRIDSALYFKGTTDIAFVQLIHGNHFDCRDEYGIFTPNGKYEPIPLTEEMLLKCGFEKVSFENKAKSYKHYCFAIPYLRGGEIEYVQRIVILISPINDKFMIAVESQRNESCICLNYVNSIHHLQNIFHNITGKELEITL